LFAYVKAKKDARFANLERPFKAPMGWKGVAMLFGLFNIPLCLIGVVYLNSLEVGWFSTWIGFIVLGMYLPIWLYTQHETRQHLAALKPALSK
ncbi:MAG: amino acid permease, partial [Methylophaga sp.]